MSVLLLCRELSLFFEAIGIVDIFFSTTKLSKLVTNIMIFHPRCEKPKSECFYYLQKPRFFFDLGQFSIETFSISAKIDVLVKNPPRIKLNTHPHPTHPGTKRCVEQYLRGQNPIESTERRYAYIGHAEIWIRSLNSKTTTISHAVSGFHVLSTFLEHDGHVCTM